MALAGFSIEAQTNPKHMNRIYAVNHRIRSVSSFNRDLWQRIVSSLAQNAQVANSDDAQEGVEEDEEEALVVGDVANGGIEAEVDEDESDDDVDENESDDDAGGGEGVMELVLDNLV